jgi:hypothetical protein
LRAGLHDVVVEASITGSIVRTMLLWAHRCGKQLVELQEDFTWIEGSIDPIEFAASATLTWTWKQQVSPC